MEAREGGVMMARKRITLAILLPLLGDRVVAGDSPDMNNVPALRGKSALIPVNSHHEPGIMDGITRVSLLAVAG